MRKYLVRLIYTTTGERIPAMMYPMLFFTFVFGMAFTFFGWTASVQASILYQITQVSLGDLFVSVWGLACLLATVLAICNILFRVHQIGYAAGWIGVLIWLYAISAFLTQAYIFQALTLVPQLWFWIWHQGRIRRYYRYLSDPAK